MERADIIDALADDPNDVIATVAESADNDNVILIQDWKGKRYKLTIESLP
jgi:hypothetical protein